MARRHVKKKKPATVTSGNYFPTLDIGLKNNYIYYNSLLMGTDEDFAMNRVIGQQAENYLEKVSSFKLQPSDDGLTRSSADKAIKFLKIAADNERAKENAWLREICDALNVNFPTDPNSVDYIQILKILNEVQKGSKQALLQIKHEAERWANTDIERVLNSKKLQNHYEAEARNLERKQAKTKQDRSAEIEFARKRGEDLYWGTIGRSGRPTDKKQIQTLAKVIGEIDKTANKLFTGSGRGFAAQAEKLIVPYVTKALTLQSSTGRFKMDPHIMQTLYREILIWIVEQIITDELSSKYIEKEENLRTTFTESNSRQRLNKIRSRIGEIGEKDLIEQIQSIVKKNQYMDSLTIPAITDEQAELEKQISQGNKDVERIISRVVNNLAADKNLQEKFRQESGIKRVGKDNKKFQAWLRKRFQLNESFSKQAIEEAIKGSVRQSYEYSEEITVREAAEQYINLMNSNMIGTTGYRPQGHPKTDVILGYINYNLEYEGDQIKKKRSELTELAQELQRAEQEMDKLLQDAYNHNSQEGDELKKFEQYWIRRNASVKDYTRNAQTFEFIRQQQLQRLEALAKTIEEKEARTKAILTKYNVLETVKDQSGLLDTFVDNSKLRERGIGFSGGAMGTNSNGLSVIDNILALGEKGNLLDPETDAEWLKFSLLNSGLGLVGHFNRHSLENYFSLFAAYLMFDDAQLIISDALASSAKDIGEKTSVQNIHLYVINGVYIPQSYILEELYKRMLEVQKGAILFNKRNLSEGTVRTQIYSYNVGSKYPGNTQEDWIRESNIAQQKIKIKMYFMMNFSDLVQQLAGMMGEI